MLCIVGAMWNAIGRLTDIALDMHLGNGENMPAVVEEAETAVVEEAETKPKLDEFLQTINLPDKYDSVLPYDKTFEDYRT